MTHYVIIKCKDAEIANNIAEQFSSEEVEVRTQDEHQFGHIHDDIRIVMSEHMRLSDEQMDLICIEEITEEVLQFDYSRYNEDIEETIAEKLKELGSPVLDEDGEEMF